MTTQAVTQIYATPQQWLSPEEIADLTGYKYAARQVKALAALGIAYHQTGCKLVVFRRDIENRNTVKPAADAGPTLKLIRKKQ